MTEGACTFTNYVPIEISGGSVQNNIAENGGGIYASNSIITLGKNAEIVSNAAGNNGGGVYRDFWTQLIAAGKIQNNIAKYGSGVQTGNEIWLFSVRGESGVHSSNQVNLTNGFITIKDPPFSGTIFNITGSRAPEYPLVISITPAAGETAYSLRDQFTTTEPGKTLAATLREGEGNSGILMVDDNAPPTAPAAFLNPEEGPTSTLPTIIPGLVGGNASAANVSYYTGGTIVFLSAVGTKSWPVTIDEHTTEIITQAVGGLEMNTEYQVDGDAVQK